MQRMESYSSPFAVQKVQKLNFRGRELWVGYPLSP